MCNLFNREGDRLRKYIRYCMCVLSIPIFIYGCVFTNYNFMLWSVLLAFMGNLIFSFENVKSRIFFMTFNIMIFVFLLSRPTVSMFRGELWWYFKRDQNFFAISSLFVTCYFLLFGAVLAEKIFSEKRIVQRNMVSDEKDFNKNLQMISLLIYVLSTVSELLLSYEKISFMYSRNYVEYYTSFETHMPLIVRGVSGFVLPSLCIFLSTKPSKKKAFIPLAVYFILGIPMLIIGARGTIVLRALFILLYYFSRDNIIGCSNKEKKWIGSLEKISIVVLLPIAVVCLSIYNYTRENTVVSNQSIVFLLVDFLYKQGVSFDVLAIGYGALKILPSVVFKNYTFGPIIDEIMHGTVSQTFFGATSLGSGNNAIKAIYGNSFSNSLAYTVRKQEYLEGHGYGSSYILESFADFGWIGVIIVSFLLGFLMICFYKWIRSNSWFLTTISFMILSSIYFIPRGETTSPVVFLITPHFWLIIISSFILAKLLCKKRSLIKVSSVFKQGTL